MRPGLDDFDVYIIDDDASVRSGLSRLMRSAGIQPHAFATPQEFFAKLPVPKDGCILLDVTMPEMSGPELIRFLKATSPRDFAVLFVTGYVGEGETDDLRGYELLRKPFTVGALASAVAAALARNSEPPRAAAKG